MLKFIKPGVMEYEIEAELVHEFLRNRAKGEAYGSIIASGDRARTLHYVSNNAECTAMAIERASANSRAVDCCRSVSLRWVAVASSPTLSV